LLVAPRGGNGGEEGEDRAIYEDGVGDSRGYYKDGAYAAAPALAPETTTGDGDVEGGLKDPQEVYYESLITRFSALRQKLAQTPPRHAVEKLDADHGSYMSGSAKDYKIWRWRLRCTDPVTAQLAGMDKGTVLRLLKMLGDRKGKLLNTGEGGKKERRRMSLWVWGLLARLPEQGELVSEEVGVVRELGKRAVWVGVEMKGVDMGGLREQIGDGEEAEQEEEDGYGNENVSDVEVDEGNDELDLEGDTGETEDFIDGDYMDGSDPRHSHWDPLDSSLLSDSDMILKIGPTLPEPLQEPTPQQSSTNNSPKRPEIIKGDTREREEAEDAALEAARVRLIERLQSHVLPPSGPRKEPLEDDDEATRRAHGDEYRDGGRDEEMKTGGVEDGEEEVEDKQSAMQGTKALLDMIITIAGEVYRQRDLLEFREVWE
jgi:hypothetical protein